MNLNKKWYEIITKYPFLNMTNFFDVPYKNIISDLEKISDWEKYCCIPRNPYERKQIKTINVGDPVGGEEFVKSRGWKNFSLFNSTGNSKDTIIHNVSSCVDRKEYLDSYRNIKNHRWTELKKYFPSVQKYVDLKIRPYFHLAFVRFMFLEPGGIIPPHNDIPPQILDIHKKYRIASYNVLNSINISLYQKKGNVFYLDNKMINFYPKTAYWINVGKEHWVVNMSSEIRIHMQIHGLYKQSYRKYVVQNIDKIKRDTFGAH